MNLFDNDRRDDQEPIKKPEVDPNVLADGVYFHMPEAQYHALHRLSASGIKNILVSIPTFWAKSWMNKDRKHNDDDTNAKILGRAYHVAIFEPETLARRYVGKPNWDNFPGILMTDTAVKAELKAMGAPQTKTGEMAIDRAYRLRDLGCKKPIKVMIEAEFHADLDDRTAIDHIYFDQIHRDIDRIAENPEIQELVTGGESEVTILWTCPDTGIKMKARIDKLKADKFVDLKSFANANGKPTKQCITDAIKYNRYYLSMRQYQVAIGMIGQLDLQIMDPINSQYGPDFWPQSHRQLVAKLKSTSKPHDAWLFFQEKDGIPNLLARRLRLQNYPDGVDMQSIGAEDHDIKKHNSVLCYKADMEIDRAKELYLMAAEVYGVDGSPWYPLDMMGEIGDDDFNDWFLEEKPA